MHADAQLRRWLALPAPIGASHVVLDELERVLRAFRELKRGEPETLHDFRVTVRRLRTLIRAYTNVLGETDAKRIQRVLKKVAHTTNAARDADVHMEWLQSERDGLRIAERWGADWLRNQLRRERQITEGDIDVVLSPKVHRALQRFRKRLRQLAATKPKRHDRKGEADTTPTLAAETADQIRRLADELTRWLRTINAPDDVRALHSARIAAKHLRYVLEPLEEAELFPTLPPFMEKLVTLQTTLGDLHDTSVFADEIASYVSRASHEAARQVAGAIRTHVTSDSATFHHAVAEAQLRDPVPGLVALTERLQSRHETGYERAQEEWLTNYAGVAMMPAYELAGALDALVLHDTSR